MGGGFLSGQSVGQFQGQMSSRGRWEVGLGHGNLPNPNSKQMSKLKILNISKCSDKKVATWRLDVSMGPGLDELGIKILN